MVNKKIIGDSLKILKTLPENKFNSVFLDPPYFRVTNEFWDKKFLTLEEYVDWMSLIFKEVTRVAKKSATLWLCGFPRQLSYLIPSLENLGWKFKQYIVINKGIKSIAGRSGNKLKQMPTATEFIAFFYFDSRNIIANELNKYKKNCNFSSKKINDLLGKASNGGGTWSSIAGKKQKFKQMPTKKDWNRLREIFPSFNWEYHDYVYKYNLLSGLTDVWSDISFYIKNRKHPTQKPTALIERILDISCEEKDWILDPFAGSFILDKIAKQKSINSVSIEIDAFWK